MDGCLGRSSSLPKWSMMICVDSETQLLLFLELLSCNSKWLCLHWKLSANVMKIPFESFSGIWHKNWYLILVVSSESNPINILLSHSLLSPIVFAVDVVGWFAKWSIDCFNYKHTSTSLIVLFWLRMSCLLYTSDAADE